MAAVADATSRRGGILDKNYDATEYHLDICIILDVTGSMDPLMAAANEQVSIFRLFHTKVTSCAVKPKMCL